MEKEVNFLEDYILEGNQLDIKVYPAACLKKKSVDVTEFNDELRVLCKDMLFTMYHAPGVGLAAPQIGKNINLFVIDCEYQREEVAKAESIEYELSSFNPQVFINPKIVEQSGEILYEEGCLSVPGVFEKVKRAESIVVEYLDMFGNPQKINASGPFAVCIQHEYDHLLGKVFLDRLSLLKKKILTKKYLKEQG